MRKSKKETSKTARPRTARNHPSGEEPVDVGFEVSKLVAAAVDAVAVPQEEAERIARRQHGRR